MYIEHIFCLFVCFLSSVVVVVFSLKKKNSVFSIKKTVKKRLRLGRCSRSVSSIEIAPVCEAAKLERAPVYTSAGRIILAVIFKRS